MRNDVSCCAGLLFGPECVGWSHSGELAWSMVGVEMAMAMPTAASSMCSWGSVSLCLVVLIYVVLWSCISCLWEPVSVYMGGCGGSQEEEYWPHDVLVLVTCLQWWLWSSVNVETWISHKVLRLLKNKSFWHQQGDPSSPQMGKAPERN